MTNMVSVASLYESNVVTVAENATIKDAAELMRKHHVGSLVVTRGKPARVVGILTDRDIVIGAVARDCLPLTIHVDEVMSSRVHTVRSSASPTDALLLMRKHGVRRLPVTDEHGYLVGILALDDLIYNYANQIGVLAEAMQFEHEREVHVRV